MKKRLTAFALTICMCLCFTPSRAQENSFSDVPEGHSAYDAVMYLAERGIINGKSETEFCPDDSLKREEFAKILATSFGLKDKAESTFIDVDDSAWYASYVEKVLASGLMIGISETEFGIGRTLSRQDLSLILKRFLDKKGISLEADSSVIYADSDSISSYAKEAADALIAAGIISGRENNMWYPLSDVTRAETAIAFFNALTYEKKKAEVLGRMGAGVQYEGPYDVPMDDRLAEAMPTPFDANIWPKTEIAFEDFEDDDHGMLSLDTEEKHIIYPEGTENANVVFSSTGGYESDGCLKITDSGWGRFVWKASSNDLQPGDYLVFSCMMKGEGIDGKGNYRNLLQIYDDKGNWLDETHQFQQKKDTEWTEYQQILAVPETANALSEPEYYVVYLGAYMNDLKGEVTFDNFRASKLRFDPMDTVLMTPNYKGIIKGEGGAGDIALRAYVDDLNGFHDLSEFKFTAQITDKDHNVLLKTESNTVKPVMDVYFSSATLPMGGDYYFESILTYKESGEQIQKQEWMLHKREEGFETVVGYDEYGRVTYNGEPMLPVRMYNYSTYDDAVPDIIEAGSIDDFMHTGVGWYYNFGTNETYRQYVKALEEAGITISLTPGSMCYSNMHIAETANKVKKQSDIRGLLSMQVNNFKDLPNLFSYYLFDEQNPMRYGEEYAWARKIIESLDLDHPTTCAIDRPSANRPGVYAKMSDFLGYDPYPVTGKEDQNLATVYDRISDGKKLNPNRPVYLIAQNFWYDTRGDLRGPNQTEYRNMIFQGLTAGACMIDSWAYRWTKEKPNPGSTFEKDWTDIKEVLAEVQNFEPIILSKLPAPYYEVENGGEWLNTMSKRYDGKSYLFTVNNQKQKNSAKIYLDGITEIKGLYSSKTYKADEDGMFNLNWNEYEVEVFEYAQEDYKSSHAELSRFGLVDSVIVDAEAKTPCFIISADKTEVEYSAKTSDYASLFINEQKAEKTGKLNLEGLSEIKVKVVSEDGRFETEKTYKIVR